MKSKTFSKHFLFLYHLILCLFLKLFARSFLTVSFASFYLLLKKMLIATVSENFCSRTKCSLHVKFLFGEYQCRINDAASLAVIFAISNFVSVKSKISSNR